MIFSLLRVFVICCFFFFFFNDTATTEIYTLSLHDALPILSDRVDSSTKVLVLMSSIHFWNIWSDWVKIGENFSWGQNFHKVVDLTVLSAFMQVLPRSE